MDLADLLNAGCLCSTLQPELLPGHLARPNMFSATPVFLRAAHAERIAEAVAALDRVAALPAWQATVLSHAPAIAREDHGPRGVFMGYDFHVGPEGPRLIEINTNAGGALLHAAALRAHRACCTPWDPVFAGGAGLDALEQRLLAMFRAEWRLQRGDAPLRTALIVDDAPAAQYLAPEFELARALFERAGIRAVVADPGELAWRDGRLLHPALPEGMPVDLVYNRLTDFDLSQPAHAALRAAWTAGAVVLTPHPRAHALHADKRNLVLLADGARLTSLGAAPVDVELLAQVVPQALPVDSTNAAQLWERRRQLFFKPATGYGSRGAYRGDKLTRRVWDEIVSGNYIAQALVPPGERAVRVAGEPTRLKLDVRAYAYGGEVLLLAARTYAGQTTNFRTPGGGFSPVLVVPPLDAIDAIDAIDAPAACRGPAPAAASPSTPGEPQ